MDNIQPVHKWLHLYLVILFLLFVSRILAFNFIMLMSVKIRRYRAIIISSSSDIYNHYWWWIVPKTCGMPVKNENRLKSRFIFSRIIHANFKDCSWSDRLNLEKIIFDTHHNQYSNTQTII